MAPDLIRAMQAPALAALLSRHGSHRFHAFETDSRVLPHEAWLAHALGLTTAPLDAPVAAAVMASTGAAPGAGHWFLVHPISIQIGNHLQMGDPAQLRLDDDESRTLFDAVLPLFNGDGHQLVYGDARTWFLRADAWAGLDTASPDAASGGNLHPWMPQGDAARAFRRLQNEVQMLWFAHPLNAAREARGLTPINSFWLWGGAGAAVQAKVRPATADVPHWLDALADPARRAATPAQLRNGDIAVAGHVLAAGLAEDWSTWLGRMQQLEDEWFGPLLAAVKSGAINQLTLVLSNRHGWLETRTTKLAQYQFWRTDTLKNLLTEVTQWK